MTAILLYFVLTSILLHTVRPGSMFRHRNLISSNTRGPIRIWVDYTDSDIEWLATDMRDRYAFSKKLIEQTQAYYASVIIVKRQQREYTWPDVKIFDEVTVKGRTVPYDLWTYFRAYRAVDSKIADADVCEFDKITGRPIVGYFELNLNAITTKPANLILLMGTFVHEFYHILVFNYDLFDKFIKADGSLVGRDNLIRQYPVIIKGQIRQAYIGENVLNFARKFLNYPMLQGVVLENDGGEGSAGSHWEHMYWSTDFMAPSDTNPSLLSELSLSMALDSGWYDVDSRFAETLEYGKGAGVDIQTDSCPTAEINGFCDSEGELSCSPDFKYKARCYTDKTYSEGCLFKQANVVCSIPDSYGIDVDPNVEILGESSRCVMTSTFLKISRPRCAKAECSGTSTIKYTFAKGKTCICEADGGSGSCSDSSISVRCPASVSDFCERMQDGNRCPADCSGRGLCLGIPGYKTCFCTYAWQGVDCKTANLAESDQKVVIERKSKAYIRILMAFFSILSWIAF